MSKEYNPDNAVLIDKDTPVGAFEIKPSPEINQEAEKPGFFETVQAGIEYDNESLNAFNFIRSMTEDFIEQGNSKDIPFDPLEQQYLDMVSPQYWPEISTSITRGELFRKIGRIENETHNKKIQSAGSTWANLTAGIINGFTSPTTLFPVGSALKTPNLLGGLKSLVKPTLQVMGGFAIGEMTLMATQETRTIQEAAMNTAVAGLMGGILGATGVGARSLKLNTYKKLTEAAIGGEKLKFNYTETGELKGFIGESVGAARAREFDLKGESLYGWGENGELQVAKPFLWATANILQNPVVKGLTSKSKAVRGFVNDMLEHNFEIAKVTTKSEAMPEALQTAIWTRQNSSFENEVHIANSYYERLGIDPEKNFASKFTRAAMKDKNQPKLHEHITEIYKAVSDGGVHADPIVQRESRRIIDKNLKPLYDEAVELGILEPNMTPFGQVQHVMRMYDHTSIVANRPERHAFLVSKFAEANEKVKAARAPLEMLKSDAERIKNNLFHANPTQSKVLKAEMKALKEKIKIAEAKMQADIKAGKFTADMLTGDRIKGDLKLRAILDEQGLKEAADNTLDTILGLTEEQLHQNLMSTFRSGSAGPNPLMPRALMIADSELIANGFLNTDIRRNFAAYNLRMSRMIEMEKYLKNRGYSGDTGHLEFLSNGIKNDYVAILNSFENEAKTKLKNLSGQALEKAQRKVEKERIKINKSLKRDVDLASNIYKRVMGQSSNSHGQMIKILNVSRKWAYSTQLGGLLLVTLQDALAPVYRQGFVPYFKYGIMPFMKNAIKMNKGNARFAKEARGMALGIELEQAFYTQRFDLNSDLMGPMNFVERVADGAANAMGVLNGASAFSDTFTRIAATASQSRLIDDLIAARAGKLDKKYLRQLLNLGLDPHSGVADKILAQFNKHGENLSGGYLPNFHLWEDAEAKRFFQGIIKKEVRSTNFNGGSLASFPIGADPNGLGGNLLMYMGWGFNATANYFLPALQKMDTNKAMGIVSMMSIASLVQPLREIADGKEPDLDPENMFKRALLSSGVLGTYGDIFNRLNAMGNIVPGMRVDRFKHTRNLFAFAGEGMVQDFTNALGATVNGEMNKTDLKRLQRMIPLTNLIYLRGFMNELIDDLDIPETRAKAEKEGSWR